MNKLIFFIKTGWATLVSLAALFLFLKVSYIALTIEDPTNKDLTRIIFDSLLVLLVAIWTNSPDKDKQ